MNNIRTTAGAHLMLREYLLERWPDLVDDPDCLADTLAGMTTLEDQIAELARSAAKDEALLEGLTQYQTRLADRRAKLKDSAAQKRRIVLDVMEDCDLKTVKAPDVTVTRQRTPPAVVITDEAALPDQFMRVKREPDKTAIKTALTSGQAVPGAIMSNGSETIRVRV